VARAAIALGSNLGDRLAHLRAGLAGLAALGAVVGISDLYETRPVGGPEQGPYLNAVVVVETELPPDVLLAGMLEVERSRDRVRDVRWGPRTLDLDLVAYDREVVDRDGLHVPHPRAHERGFVLAPLVDVWPEVLLADGSTARDALAVVGRSGLHRWRGDWPSEMPHLGPAATRWVAAQIVLFAIYGAALVAWSDPAGGPFLVLGSVLAVAGAGLGAWAVLSLGSNLTPYPQPRTGTVLVAHGPYRWARHPIYGAIVVGLAGVAMAVRALPALLLAAGIGWFFSRKSRVEERALAIGVPGYADYAGGVRRRMIPFLW
jgi:2-amino-4-hydroxy-6-hydroxymethyldihydropteridine diphosphokinase